MFVLTGDIKKKGKLYSMLCDIAKPGTLEQIIIKMQHNCVSDNRTYAGRFVPIKHEYLMVLRKDSSIIYDIGLTHYHTFDIRNSKSAIWRDVVAAVLEDNGNYLCPVFMIKYRDIQNVHLMYTGKKKFDKHFNIILILLHLNVVYGA